MEDSISDDVKKKINDIVSKLCSRSGEYLIALKDEGENRAFFKEHLIEIAKAITNIKQEDLKSGETLNKFLFMCIGLFDTDDSRKIIYDKLTYPGIISVFKDMDNNHKLKYSNYLPDDLVTNDYFFAQLSIEPNSKVGKLLNPVYRFIHRHKKSDRPWVLDESEKSFFADSKKKIRDAIANLNKEDFKGNENEANKFKLSCCRLFSDANDRKVIFTTIGDGSDADIFLTFQNLNLTEQQGREFFPYLPDDLQIKDVFEYTFKHKKTVDDLERQMLENFKFKSWTGHLLSIGFIFLLILLVPTGFASLILWCSSDYRENLKAKIRNEKLCFKFMYKDDAERLESEVKSEVKCRFIMDIIKSIPAILNFIWITYLFIVVPFSILISDFFVLIFLALQLGLMIYTFIANFKLIKSLCKEIKDAVENNQQIQRTLNARRDRWKLTLKEIGKKLEQQKTGNKQLKKSLSPNILLLTDYSSTNDVNMENNTNDLNSKIRKEDNKDNNNLIINIDESLITDNTSKIIQIQNQNLPKKQKPKKNRLYNKIGAYGCPDELNLESAPESEEEIKFQ